MTQPSTSASWAPAGLPPIIRNKIEDIFYEVHHGINKPAWTKMASELTEKHSKDLELNLKTISKDQLRRWYCKFLEVMQLQPLTPQPCKKSLQLEAIDFSTVTSDQMMKMIQGFITQQTHNEVQKRKRAETDHEQTKQELERVAAERDSLNAQIKRPRINGDENMANAAAAANKLIQFVGDKVLQAFREGPRYYRVINDDTEEMSPEDQREMNRLLFDINENGNYQFLCCGNSVDVALPSLAGEIVSFTTNDKGWLIGKPENPTVVPRVRHTVEQRNDSTGTVRRLQVQLGSAGQAEWLILLDSDNEPTRLSDATVVTALSTLIEVKRRRINYKAGASVTYSYGSHSYTATVHSEDVTAEYKVVPSFHHIAFNKHIELPDDEFIEELLDSFNDFDGVIGQPSEELASLASMFSRTQDCSEHYGYTQSSCELWVQRFRGFLKTIQDLRTAGRGAKEAVIVLHGPNCFDTIRDCEMGMSSLMSRGYNVFGDGIYVTPSFAISSGYARAGNNQAIDPGTVLMGLLVLPTTTRKHVTSYQLGPNNTAVDPEQERDNYPMGGDINDAYHVAASELLLLFGKIQPEATYTRRTSMLA